MLSSSSSIWSTDHHTRSSGTTETVSSGINLKIDVDGPITRVTSDTLGEQVVAGDSLGYIYSYHSVLRRVTRCYRLPSCVTALLIVDDDFNSSGVNLVAASSKGNRLHFLRLSGDKCLQIEGINDCHLTCINSLSCRGNLLISSSPYDRCLVWNLNTFSITRQLKDKRVKKVYFMGASSIVQQRSTHQICIIDLDTFNLVKKIDRGLILSSPRESHLIVMPLNRRNQHHTCRVDDEALPLSAYDELGNESEIRLRHTFHHSEMKDDAFRGARDITVTSEDEKHHESAYCTERRCIVKSACAMSCSAVHSKRAKGGPLTRGEVATARSSNLLRLFTMSHHSSGSGHFIAFDSHGCLVTRDGKYISPSTGHLRFTFVCPFRCQGATIHSLLGVTVTGQVYIIEILLHHCIKGVFVNGELTTRQGVSDEKDERNIIKCRVNTLAHSLLTKFGHFPAKHRVFLWRWLLDPLVDTGDEECCTNRACDQCKRYLQIASSSIARISSPSYSDASYSCNLMHILSQLIHWNESLVETVESPWQVIDLFFSLFPNLSRKEECCVVKNKKHCRMIVKLVATFIVRGFLSSSRIHLHEVSAFIRKCSRISSSPDTARHTLTVRSPAQLSWNEHSVNDHAFNLIIDINLYEIVSGAQLRVLLDHVITRGRVFRSAFIASLYFHVVSQAQTCTVYIDNHLVRKIVQQLGATEFRKILLLADDILHSQRCVTFT